MPEPQNDGDSVLIAQIEKNKKEEIRVSLDTFHGKKLINIRIFFRDETGVMKPSGKGVTLGVDQYKLLAGAIVDLGKHLKEEGLL